jgi:Flp pilus assembly protein TadB
LVLIILAVIWAAVLLPPYLQNRSENRPADSISSFRNQLSVLERRTGTSSAGYGYGPAPLTALRRRAQRSGARKRRRDILFTLVGAAALTAVLALALGGPVWALHLMIDGMLVGYVAMLARAQRVAQERQAKVRYLPRSASVPPTFALRRSAN